jgi:uncharacterized protein
MKIVLPGGSGQLGNIVAGALQPLGHEVVVLSRTPQSAPWRVVAWDAETLGDWKREIDGADAVLNLAGRSVNCRYTAANRKAIIDSRVNSTRVVGEAIADAARPPKVWLQMSSATIYSHRYDAPNDELTGLYDPPDAPFPETWHFSIEVVRKWEAAINEANTPQTRKVILRQSLGMSPDRGGVFDVMMKLVQKRLGGKLGDGRQYQMWIHELDFVRAIQWLIAHDLSGPVNICSPNPLPNADFMRAMRQAYGTRIGLPATKWMLEIGAFFMRTETELILKSRRVAPTRLLQSGFTFQYPDWPEAARELCQRWRAS